MSKKLIIVISLVVVLLAAGGYWYYRETIFSKSILKLEILGPENVQMGQEFEYTIKYKNNSNFTLEEPRLDFEYPEFTINEEGKTRVSQVLKDIYPGDEQFIQFKARLIGKEDDLKVAKAYLSYKPQNLKARYESSTTFTTKIDMVPITLDFDLPSKMERGKEIEFPINYFSNADFKLSGLRLEVDYPEKFSFISSNPQSLDNNEWEIADLDKAQGGRISIIGNLTEEVGNKIQFKARIGLWKDGEFTLLKEATKEVEIIEPLLYISQQINGSSTYIPSPGETLHYEIYFRNIGRTPFENLFLTNTFDSSIFDLTTLKVDAGQIRADDNMVIWDWKQVPELNVLGIQEEGKVEFDVTLKKSWVISDADFNNTFIKNKVNISQITQDFQTKVNSRLVVLQKGYYQDSVFGNTGPSRPVVGQQTTYTITWQAQNYYNDVKNVKVRATLPPGVVLTGRISPDSEISRFSFDSNSREILWNVANDMAPGTGVTNNPPSVSFQVSLTPTPSQVGRVALIMNKATIAGEDSWTGQSISTETPGLDTTLPDDSSITNHSGTVQ